MKLCICGHRQDKHFEHGITGCGFFRMESDGIGGARPVGQCDCPRFRPNDDQGVLL